MRLDSLRLLRKELYADPALVVIDYLERNPDADVATIDFAKFRQFAHDMRREEEWWAPLMVAWQDLATSMMDQPGEARAAMVVLVEAMNRLDRRLVEEYGLPRLGDITAEGRAS